MKRVFGDIIARNRDVLKEQALANRAESIKLKITREH